MDINQLFSDVAILAGMLLVAVLAIGPLWLAEGSPPSTHAARHDTRTQPSANSRSHRRHHAPGHR